MRYLNPVTIFAASILFSNAALSCTLSQRADFAKAGYNKSEIETMCNEASGSSPFPNKVDATSTNDLSSKSNIANTKEIGRKKIASFAILTIHDPVNYDIKKHPISIPILDKNARKLFTEGVNKDNPKLGLLMRNSLQAELTKAGLTEVLAPDISIDPYDPRAVDYKNIKTEADAIIHVYFESAGARPLKMVSNAPSIYGLPSENTDENFQPYLYAGYCVVVKRMSNQCSLENSAAYGDGATVDGNLEYRAEESKHWKSAEEVLANIPSIIDAYKSGTNKMAKGISEKVISYPSQ